jgi:hypothetical protein
MAKKTQAREKGEYKALTILEIVGKPKEHIEKTLKDYIKQIEKDKRYAVASTSTKRAKKLEGEMYSAFAELTFYTKDMQSILDFALDYLPASIEIEEPEKITLKNTSASAIVNDFLVKLHQVDMVAKGLKQKNLILSKSVGILIQNAILILLNLGPKTKEEIGKYVGVRDEQLSTFLKMLKDDKKIAEKDGRYSLPK